jgi:DNA-3-methyladenine glycosylase
MLKLPPMLRLSRDFFARDTLTVARDLLGRHLVRVSEEGRVVGRVVEAEAYIGQDDLACHGSAGRTPRNAVMFGPPGHAYVYFTYGMHWLLNVVAKQPGVADHPAAVLLRAIEPIEGPELIAARRAGRPPGEWTNGPAKLTLALDIDGRFNGLDVTAPDSPLFFEPGKPVSGGGVATGPRVGLGGTPEPWKSLPWRFYVRESPHVSRGR